MRAEFLLGIGSAVASLALAACAPAPCEQRYGYYLVGDYPDYSFERTLVTPSGIEVSIQSEYYQGLEAGALGWLLERQVAEVEACLERRIDRSAFRVVVPNDWHMSCDGTQQVLPFQAPDRTCKGEDATATCACHYRAIVQCDCGGKPALVTTPNLALFKDVLVRLVTGSANPWVDPTLEPCLAPGAGVVSQ